MKVTSVFVILFFLLAGAVFCQSENLEVEVFEIKHRDVRDLQPVAESLKSDKGKVSAEPGSNTLIVIDYASNLQKMGRIIRILDVPQKQVEIKVLVTEVTSVFLRKIGVFSGRVVIPPGKFSEIQYLLNNSTDSIVRSQMVVRTLSGRPATIRVSREEIFGGMMMAREDDTVIFPPVRRSAGNFLEVLPKVNSDGTIVISLRPAVSEFQKDRSIHERSILTQVVINDGDTLILGGFDRAEQRAEQATIPFTEMSVPLKGSEESRKIVMFLTATVMD